MIILAVILAWPGRLTYQSIQRQFTIRAIQANSGVVYEGDRGSIGVRMGTADLNHLRQLRDTVSLDLQDSMIDDETMAELRHFDQLKALFLIDCSITDAGIEHLAGLETLEVLFLGGTGITDEGLESLANLTNVYLLHLDDT